VTIMADNVLSKPDPQAYVNFIRAQAAALHAKDTPPGSRREWEQRRTRLRAAMFTAMGPFPDKPCDLDAKVVGVLKRDGYRIEKILFQSRPDVWATANAVSFAFIGSEHVTITLPERSPACFNTASTRDQCTASNSASACRAASRGVAARACPCASRASRFSFRSLRE